MNEANPLLNPKEYFESFTSNIEKLVLIPLA
jgi:hypothetical protein